MRHLAGGSASPVPFIRKFAHAAGLASLCGSASLMGLFFMSSRASADTVWITKDCSLLPCTISAGGTPAYPGQVAGRFRVISAAQFQWSALYQGTVQRFWVSQGGINMATQQLSTANGQLGGMVSLPNGLWFISAQTANMGPGTYSVSGSNVLGDPHITTMNGTQYDFQGAGEFVLLKNSAAGFEVQSRMAPVSTVAPLPPDPHTGISSCPSINTAAAVKSPRHRISYQPATIGNAGLPQMRLRIDGRPRALPSRGITLDDGTRLTRDRTTGELRITLRNGWGVRIIPHWWSATGLWYLDFDFTPATNAAGIAGPIARGSWLPALSDGSSVGNIPQPIPERYKVLYERFGKSWRVTDATSLFDYQAGTSTATSTNTEWPGQGDNCRIPNTTPLVPVSEQIARTACAGVIPSFQRACIADVMATGDKIFAAGYVKTQGPKRFTLKYEEKRSRK